MPAPIPETPMHALLEAFRTALEEVLTQAMPSAWTVQVKEADADTPSLISSALYFQLSFSGDLQGTGVFLIETSDALQVAQRALGENVGPSAEFKPDHEQALLNLFRQVSAAATIHLKNTLGEIQLQTTTTGRPEWQGAVGEILASESNSSLRLEFRLSPELQHSISSRLATHSAAIVTPAANQATGPTTDPKLDLILGVNLNLTLRFGQRVLSLREILDLNAGSIVELDREVQEPADLLMGDKLIARGEVVIVDGNYGLRVTEVADPGQRLERLQRRICGEIGSNRFLKSAD